MGLSTESSLHAPMSRNRNQPDIPDIITPISFPMTQTTSDAAEISAAALNPVVRTVYPLEELTRWHQRSHLPGLTGRWMDTGGTALGGAVRGPWHRLAHGHNLFGDGLKVIATPKLKFAEFLHHLGLDFFTKTGIPNPLIPKRLGELLLRSGLSRTAVAEMLTVNVPKVLGGGLSLICSGMDVYAMFSDTIPHTFGAAGKHLLFGAIELALGCYPPNPLLIASGGIELAVSGVTAFRAMCEPVVHTSPLAAFLPVAGASVLLSGLFSVATGCLLGRSKNQIMRTTATSLAASSVTATVAGIAKATGVSLGLAGLLPGIATSCLMYYLLHKEEIPRVHYTSSNPLLRSMSRLAAGFALPDRPIARIEGGALRMLGSGKSLTIG